VAVFGGLHMVAMDVEGDDIFELLEVHTIVACTENVVIDKINTAITNIDIIYNSSYRIIAENQSLKTFNSKTNL
jgi:hypothetical protein